MAGRELEERRGIKGTTWERCAPSKATIQPRLTRGFLLLAPHAGLRHLQRGTPGAGGRRRPPLPALRAAPPDAVSKPPRKLRYRLASHVFGEEAVHHPCRRLLDLEVARQDAAPGGGVAPPPTNMSARFNILQPTLEAAQSGWQHWQEECNYGLNCGEKCDSKDADGSRWYNTLDDGSPDPLDYACLGGWGWGGVGVTPGGRGPRLYICMHMPSGPAAAVISARCA